MLSQCICYTLETYQILSLVLFQQFLYSPYIQRILYLLVSALFLLDSSLVYMAFLHSWEETHVISSNTIRCYHLGIYALAYSTCVITTVHQNNLRWRVNNEYNYTCTSNKLTSGETSLKETQTNIIISPSSAQT